MSETVYKALIGAMAMRGGAAPAIDCPELNVLLEELFTPEEAALVCQMPVDPISASALASETGRDLAEVEALLDGMCNKGLVISREREGVNHYSVLQMMPGIFEYQFMRGEVNERAKRLAKLFDDYFEVIFGWVEKGPVPQVLPFSRVITVEEEIKAGMEIQPYDRVSSYIDNADYISVSTCYCRHHGELLDRPCDKPKEVCLIFGPAAKFNDERGFGRLISKEEAHRILDLSEKEGLVHCSSNMGKYVDFICNCCICHCFILRSMERSGMPSMAATSSFVMVVREDDCTGCGACVDRCQMSALALVGDEVAKDGGRCIGCGLCVSACPTEALRMEHKPEATAPPWDRRGFNAAVASSLFGEGPSSS
jgi:NAD-dependent dihydropyrimidine dehydrogenase PreA subunit